MIYRRNVRLTISILSIAALSIAATSLPAGGRKVLTIALDGLRPDALLAANAPNVDSLTNGTYFGTSGPSGIFPMNAQAEHLTFSGPGWGRVHDGPACG